MSKNTTAPAVLALATSAAAQPKPSKAKAPKVKTVEEKIAAMAERSAATELTVGGLIAEAEALNAAEEAAPVVDKKAALREEARARFLNAKHATKAHGYALISACDGDTDEERLASMREEIAKLPEAIRAKACKLGMDCTAPGRRTHALLKQLHDEQPASSSTRTARGAGSTFAVCGRGKAKTPTVQMPLPSALGVAVGDRVTVSTTTIDGETVLIVRAMK
jgi:hypothetical protein